MANEQNLRPVHTKEEARERGRKGGIKSGEVRRQKKTIRETVKAILDQPVTEAKHIAAINRAGLPVGDSPTYRDFLTASILIGSIQKGKMSDLLLLMDVLGEERDSTNTEMLDKARELLGGIDSAIDD